MLFFLSARVSGQPIILSFWGCWGLHAICKIYVLLELVLRACRQQPSKSTQARTLPSTHAPRLGRDGNILVVICRGAFSRGSFLVAICCKTLLGNHFQIGNRTGPDRKLDFLKPLFFVRKQPFFVLIGHRAGPNRKISSRLGPAAEQRRNIMCLN